MISKYLFAFISILLGSVGQLFLKIGANEVPKITIKSLLVLLLNRNILLGLFCYGLSVLLWIKVLSTLKLSVAYPLVSLGYIFAALWGVLFLHEQLSRNFFVGMAFIMLGIFYIIK